MSTPSGPGHGRPDPGLSAIRSERRQLINLAYRLLGSLAEAEDAVQETYARWYAMSRHQQEAIESPGAWLTTVASRICLDLLGTDRLVADSPQRVAVSATLQGDWILSMARRLTPSWSHKPESLDCVTDMNNYVTSSSLA